MREFKRIYYTLVAEGDCTITGSDPYTVSPTTWGDVSAVNDGMYVVIGNTIGVIYDYNALASETFKYSVIGTPESLGYPKATDYFYVIDDADYFDAWVNRTVTTEHAFYSNLYQQYNSITTERVVVESYGTWVFSDTGTTDGGYELLKDINKSKLMVLGDCGGNNYAKKIVYDNTATGRATNNRVKYGFIARVIA